ncbi:MAG TPA: hypothetical protein VK597_06610, partial [Inquilinus sp.]|nr:hypothetical protein [Inquilinus sp.]
FAAHHSRLDFSLRVHRGDGTMPRFDPIATPHDFSVTNLGNQAQLLAVGEEVFKAATSPADLYNFIQNAKTILQQPSLRNGLDPIALTNKSLNIVVDTDDVINIIIPKVQTVFKTPQEREDYMKRIGFMILCGCR